MILSIKYNEKEYDVIIKRGCLNNINEYIDLNRKVLIVSDTGIPNEYIEILKNQINDHYVYIIHQGEESKSFKNYELILDYLIDNSFTRNDCIIALGGGVVGDLAGFVASTYMRGITFYNIPTTLLSQVDSSIGGKTAIDKNGIKNIVGAFYPPTKVFIDSNVLKTLNKRQLHNGLVEAIKMSLTNDKELFELIKNSNNLYDDIDEIIIKALLIKKDVVEKDPLEKNIRKVLNFGHTIGHAIESNGGFNQLLHGECVGIGMLYFSSNHVKKEIISVLEKYNLPTKTNITKEDLYKYISHDKKRKGNEISIVYVENIGNYILKNIPIETIKEIL
jgi:3-dehydroquinate synthase